MARDPLTMSAAGPRAALALKTQSALMSGDMGIAPTVAGGQAQRPARTMKMQLDTKMDPVGLR